MQLSKNLRRTAAITLVFLVVGAGWTVVAEPIWSQFEHGYGEIEGKRQLLARYTAIAARHAIAREKSDRANARLAGGALLDSGSETLASADLQKKLKALASQRRASLRSANRLANRERNGNTYVGIRIQLNGSLEAIHTTIYGIENGSPFMFINAAQLNAGQSRRATPDAGQPMIDARLDVYVPILAGAP